MFTVASVDAEPPQSTLSQPLCVSAFAHAETAALMLAAFPPDQQTHAVVIGRHILDPALLLVKSGCLAVETHVLNAAQTHPEPASLAWISDVSSEQELDEAVTQASSCLNQDGSLVLDATELSQPTAVAIVTKSLIKVGFHLRSILHQGQHLILVAARRPQPVFAS